jgi:hypothetical protein
MNWFGDRKAWNRYVTANMPYVAALFRHHHMTKHRKWRAF